MKKHLLRYFFSFYFLLTCFISVGQFPEYVKNPISPSFNDGYIKVYTDTLNTPITYSWSTGETTKNIFNLSPGNYSVTITDATNQIIINDYEVGITDNNYQFNWTTTISPFIHFIDIPGGNSVNINGQNLQIGDKIGVFYDSTGYWACGGSIVWDGLPQTISVYGDTFGLTGFDEGEQFLFLIRSQLYGFDFVAQPEYDLSGTTFSNDSLFLDSGTSALLSLQADSVIMQTSLLSYGWNDFYSWIDPIEPACQIIFYSNSGSLNILRDTLGNIYWPAWMLDNIGDIQLAEPILARMNFTDYFQFAGYLIDTTIITYQTNTCYNVPNGYIHLIPTYGIPPYSYLWNNGQTSQFITDIPINTTYSVTITDSQSNQKIRSINATPTYIVYQDPYAELIVENTSNLTGGSIEANIDNWSAINYYWSNGINDTIITNQPAGTYYLTIENSLGCLYDTSATILNSAFDISMFYNNVTAAGASDGVAWAEANSGISPYAYLWSTGETSLSINGLSTGFYSVTVTDALGDEASGFVQITSPIFINPIIQQPTISSSSDGSITLIVTGGQAPYSYLWANGNTTPSMSNLSIGQYDVTITDILGNTISDEFYLDVIEISSNNTDPTSATACNGAIDITVSGGFSPFTYLWSNGSTTEDISALCSAIYSVTVTDSIGFVISMDIGLILSNSIVFSSPSNTGQWHMLAFISDSLSYIVNGSPIGVGDLIGAFYQTNNDWHCAGYFEWTGNPTLSAVSIFGDNPQTTSIIEGYQYGEEFKWFIYDSSIGQNFYEPAAYYSQFPNGQFYFANGQSGVKTLGIPTTSLHFNLSITDVSCYGGNDGSASFNNLTGMSPFTFQWSNGTTSSFVNNLSAGSYSVTVTDNNNIQSFQSFNISEVNSLTVSAVITNASSAGTSDGIVDLTVFGGTPGYSYNWSNGSVSSIIFSVGYGTYTVTISDANSCELIESFTVDTIPANLLAVSEIINDVDCIGNCTGSIDLTINGGNPPISISWSNGETTEDIETLCAGTYDVDIFENNSILTGPPQPWSYTNTGINHTIVIGPNNLLINGIPPPTGSLVGVFYINNGLLECGGYTEYQNTTIAVTAWGDDPTNGFKNGFDNGEVFQWFVSVNGVSIPLDANYMGNMPNVGNYFTNGMSQAVLYATYLPDLSLSFTVNEPDSIQVVSIITNTTSTYNSDGEINVTVNGGVAPYNYIWSTGATTQNIASLYTGIYYLTIIDANSCNISEIFFVEIQPLVPITAVEIITDIDCFGNCNGGIDLTVSGGTMPYTYSWSNGATTQDLTNVCAGNYSVSISDNLLTTPTVQWPWDFSITASNHTILIQGNTNITINGLPAPIGSIIGVFYEDNGIYKCGGYSEWTGATSAITAWGDDPQTPDKDGFIVGETFIFQVYDNITSHYVVPDYMTATPNQELYITNGLSGLDALQSPTGNNVIYNYTLQEPSLIIASSIITSVSSSVPANGSIEINVTGGIPPYNFVWSNGETTEDISNLTSNLYELTITDANLCEFIESYQVDNVILSLDLVSQNIDCYGLNTGSIWIENLNGVTPITYNWSNGMTTDSIYGLSSGQYFLTATDAVGSSFYATTTINQPDSIFITSIIADATAVIGNDGAIDLTIIGGTSPYTILWSNGATTEDISQLVSGIYNVSITDANLCIYTNSLQVTQLSGGPLTTSGNSLNINCYNECTGTIDLTISGGNYPYYYSWDNGETIEDISGLCAGNYNVQIFDAGTGVIGSTLPWTYTNTGQNHTVAILSNAFTINGPSIEYGDYLGVFFIDNGNLVCGGYKMWLDNGQNLAFTVWGDDPGTPDKDGFLSGESFNWKVWKANDGSTFEISAIYNTGLPDQGNYSPNGMSVVNNLSGTYIATTSNITNLSFTITQPDTLSLNSIITLINPSIGNDGAIDITPAGGTPPYNFLWSGGQTTEDLNNLSYGLYFVTITDVNSCSIIDSFMVDFSSTYLSFNLTPISPVCYGLTNGQILLENLIGIQPITFLWSTGETTQNVVALTVGTYYVTVSTGNGEIVIDSVEITQPDQIVIDFVTTFADPVLQTNGSIDITVTGGTTPYSYFWSDGSTDEDISSAPYGQYLVTVTDAILCLGYNFTFVDFNLLPDWNFDLSGLSHSIEIPAYALLQINGMSLEMNDFIGVFYDSLGIMSCGGYTVWQQSTDNLLAYGDDLPTSDPEGFASGEEFQWKVWDVSTNTEYLAAPSYNQYYPNQQYFVENGESGIDSLQVVTISGTVATTTKSNLPLGMVILYQENEGSYYAVEKGLVTDGQYLIEGILPGQYLIYAIPAPGFDYGVPGYFVQRNSWEDASLIHAYAYTGSIDIVIDPVIPYNTGNGAISGNIYVGSDNSYNPDVFGDEWFPGTIKDDETPARNIPILLFDDQMNAMDFRLSNDLGAFEFEQLELGTYFVRVEKAGLQADEIEITLTAENPVSDGMTFSLESGQVISVPELLENDNFIIYPNPVKEELFVRFEDIQISDIQLKIYNITGQQINIPELSSESNTQIITIDMKSYSPGIYLLEISNNSQKRVYKVNKI